MIIMVYLKFLCKHDGLIKFGDNASVIVRINT